jgi:small GTP-binding protein
MSTPTIGIDFKIRVIELEGQKVKLQLLDTAGQERFKTITAAHYRCAMGILLVYDVTNEQSFKNIEDWIQNVEKHTRQPVNMILIGPDAAMLLRFLLLYHAFRILISFAFSSMIVLERHFS